MRKFRILAAFFLVVVAASGLGYAYLQRQLRIPHTPASPAQAFEIPPGLGARGVIRLLRERDVISSENLALAYLILSGSRKELKAGEYEFKSPTTIPEVLDKIAAGSIVLHRFTVPEGLTAAEIAAAWQEQGFGAAEEFLAAAEASGDLVRDLIGGETARGMAVEGYLFPETYSFAIRTRPRRAIEAMVARFRQVVGRLEKEIPEASWLLRPRETLILASLVEAEAARDDERPLIASVFLNRLKKKMLLQCDPTVVYALEKENRYRGRLTTGDLKFDSPYNTYRYPGLPPGPIANPGYRSLEAVLRPAATGYLFFVRTTEGRHAFSENLAAHNRAVAAYRRMQREARSSAPRSK